MGRGEDAEFNKVLRLDKTARGRERRRDQQRVAGLRVLDAIEVARIVEKNADARAGCTDPAAKERERT